MAAVTHTNCTIAPGIKAHIATEYDISHEICSVKEKGIDLRTHWVKAHQDDKTPVALLLLNAQLNIQADADVTTLHHSPPPELVPSSNPVIFLYACAYIQINGVYVTSQLQQWLRSNHTSSDIKTYIMCHNGLTHQQMQQINWRNL
eukprot:11135712-Ditylum_brightwellii.AAC.1